MRGHDIVITGAGAVTPLGHCLDETRRALTDGACAAAPPRSFDASGFGGPLAAEVREFDARPFFTTPKALKLTDRPGRFAVAAAAMTLRRAGWDREVASPERLGVAIGTSGHDLLIEQLAGAVAPDEHRRTVTDIRRFADRVRAGLPPLWLLTVLPNMISAHVGIQFGATGPNTMIMTGAAAGLQAIGEGCDWLRAREADAVLAGASDSVVNPLCFAAFAQAGLFDADPGFVPGEGAAIVLLERRADAEARGARVLAAVAGHATRAGDPAAMRRATHAALAAAGWTPGHVDRHLGPVPALQRRLGHAMAAAAPIEMCLALDPLPGAAPPETLLMSAGGFGGPAAALGLRLAHVPVPPREAALHA